MEKTNLNDGLMAQMIEEEAWKNLSSNYPWDESLLEKYKDKVDWGEVSGNSDIEWTVSMLEKFKNRIAWERLSSTSQKSILTPEVVERFKDRWAWKELSENTDLPLATIREMADYIDWCALVNRGYREELFGVAFLKEFEDRIPASAFKDSCLWHRIVDEKEELIRAEIALG